uniref:Uncharacterized protein n=1 Tax=Pristionchus pacificus TaxID=54126 RepID=A0A2A6D0F7_PRIPA|eukprot:PDM83962.1 hypothetical protein PRIPAC_34154 [Pristionchus pacificus]
MIFRRCNELGVKWPPMSPTRSLSFFSSTEEVYKLHNMKNEQYSQSDCNKDELSRVEYRETCYSPLKLTADDWKDPDSDPLLVLSSQNIDEVKSVSDIQSTAH